MMKKAVQRHSLLILFFALATQKIYAQLPETRIFVFDVERVREGRELVLQFSNPQRVGASKGYNNQPYFSEDDIHIYYASNYGKGNTDIYRYNMPRKRNKRLSKTKEAEYSPRENKIEDNEINCVRVEKDTVTQHFYAYTKKGKPDHVLLPELKTIGYYAWLNGIDLIAFTLPEPFTLAKYNVSTMKADTLATNIGRSIQVHNNKVYYVDKSDSNEYYIRMVAKENIRPRKDKPKGIDEFVCKTLEGEEDFCITYDGTIYMAKAGKLYAYYTKPRKGMKEGDWNEVADFNKFGISKFYRLAFNQSMTKFALVEYVGDKP